MNSVKKFTSESEVEAELLSYAPQRLTMGIVKLERIQALLKHVGNPQQALKVIHIAGTSGKTSTSYYVRALLEASGAKTGLTVSPHIDTIRERVQISGQPIPTDAFVQYFNDFYPLVDGFAPRPTYFELVTAFAFCLFQRENVDYAVIETGLGGRLDATNTVDRLDKICVLTPIGYDHTEILGDTLTKIAVEKAGIIGTGNVVFTTEQDPEAQVVIESAVHHKQATLKVIHSNIDPASDAPAFQQQNFSLALEVVRYVAARDGWQLLEDAQNIFGQVHVPGRWELYRVGDKTVVLDGAHNPQKLAAFFEATAQHGMSPAVVVAGLSEAPDDKIKQCVQIISSHAAKTIYTTFEIQRDVTRKSVSLDALSELVGGQHSEYIGEAAEALSLALRSEELFVIVTGSLYLVSILRPLVQAIAE